MIFARFGKAFLAARCYKYSAPDGAPINNTWFDFKAMSPEASMKRFANKVLFLISFALLALNAQAQTSEAQRWRQRARNVTITRDDWGIAHIHGRTDADAVFGMIYAQAEDDFNRVEMNYINSMGRLAEAEGEEAIWRDLRRKIFIDPSDMKPK